MCVCYVRPSRQWSTQIITEIFLLTLQAAVIRIILHSTTSFFLAPRFFLFSNFFFFLNWNNSIGDELTYFYRSITFNVVWKRKSEKVEKWWTIAPVSDVTCRISRLCFYGWCVSWVWTGGVVHWVVDGAHSLIWPARDQVKWEHLASEWWKKSPTTRWLWSSKNHKVHLWTTWITHSASLLDNVGADVMQYLERNTWTIRR